MEVPENIPGYFAPVHRSLVEPILLGGAPRTVAIVNGTLAAALGLGLRLWVGGAVLWLLGQPAGLSLPLVHARDLHGPDGCDKSAGEDPPPVVRQA
ncbi:conjugal transfer protein TrbD [Komagataeibacter swingsii DSM 16373]|nr:conjugal transfer protein TrbD [Komagataeibacter swingsii DSM 16373]